MRKHPARVQTPPRSGHSSLGGCAALVAAAALAHGLGCGAASLRSDAGSSGNGGTPGAGGSGPADAAPDAPVDTGGSGGAPDAGPARDATADAPVTPTTDAAPIADAAPDAAGCVRPKSCAILHACNSSATGGNYMIFPDGAADAGLLVHCDMETAGGGWTVIFLANAVDLDSTAIPYTVPTQSLRDTAQEALIAFRNLNLNMLASDWASFGLPATWRSKNPLAVAPFEELTVSAAVNGALPALALLRYGVANFASLCSDDWTATAGDLYGRICLRGTTAAFYSGFTTATAVTDFCSLSNQSYATRPCSDTARFSIAVR